MMRLDRAVDGALRSRDVRLHRPIRGSPVRAPVRQPNRRVARLRRGTHAGPGPAGDARGVGAARRRPALRAVVITVEGDDGMSWSAAATERAVQRHERSFGLIRFTGSRPAGALTELERAGISRRQIARIAQRTKVTRAYRWLAPLPLLALGLVFVAATVGIAVATALGAARSGHGAMERRSDQRRGAGAGRGRGAARAGGRAAAHAADDPRRGDAHAVRGAGRRARGAPRRARELQGRARGRTGRALRGLLRDRRRVPRPRRAHPRDGPLPPGGPRRAGPCPAGVVRVRGPRAARPVDLARPGRALFRAGPEDARSGKHVQQLFLSPPSGERLRPLLAAQWAADEPVREVCHGPRRGDTSSVDRFLEGYRTDGAATNQALKLLHLLAAPRLARGRVEFSPEWVERELAGHADGTGRWEVLRMLLEDRALTKAELRRVCRDLGVRFDALLEDPEGGAIETSVVGATALEAGWATFGLPDPDIVHLFWALYFSGGEPTPFWLRKVADHARRALPPAAAGLGTDVTDQLFWACVNTARDSLRASLFEDVPDLLDSAEALLEDEAYRDGRGGALRGLSWQVYALLGDEDALQVLLKLRAPGYGYRPRRREPTRPLVRREPVDPRWRCGRRCGRSGVAGDAAGAAADARAVGEGLRARAGAVARAHAHERRRLRAAAAAIRAGRLRRAGPDRRRRDRSPGSRAPGAERRRTAGGSRLRASPRTSRRSRWGAGAWVCRRSPGRSRSTSRSRP